MKRCLACHGPTYADLCEACERRYQREHDLPRITAEDRRRIIEAHEEEARE